jgi:L-fucose isomerase-like protein
LEPLTGQTRFLFDIPAAWLQRPPAVLQPVLARAGEPTVDPVRLQAALGDLARVEPAIAIQSPEHWAQVIAGLGEHVDAILPISVAAYPTEIWNAHPQPLVERGLPVLFWSLLDYDEPDFWRWSTSDMLRSLGIDVTIIQNHHQGESLVRALAMKRFLRAGKMVVFGEQNFPWNAYAAGENLTRRLGTHIAVRPIADIRARYPQYSDADIDAVIDARLTAGRYERKTVREAELRQAVRSYLAIRDILIEEQAFGFGLNCFGDLIIQGGRDVPCLAQLLLREDGYIASCDGDFLAMLSMALTTYYLDLPSMMSNMYPVRYVGALTGHFGNPLAPEGHYMSDRVENMARLGHCAFVGVVSPEMALGGKVALQDWGGTLEIPRDGRGCGIGGDLVGRRPVTVVELCFDAKRLLVARARTVETSHHTGMPHCESTALLEFRDLKGFISNISREHTVISYGDHVADFEILARVLGLECLVF